MRSLAATFAFVGLFFLFNPDGVIARVGEVGDWFGSFSGSAETDQKFWLGLGFAYMTVITGIVLVVSTDVVRYRPLLLVLAAGKLASSLTTGVFFLEDDVFINLLNFLVDGSLVFVALFCWSLAGRVESATPG
ncbi:MAG: hypothetical protein H0V29_11730 [Thermoleophilaceae bacterium]|nr:hypothetical protein [Thermoleophilaceae bacterium]